MTKKIWDDQKYIQILILASFKPCLKSWGLSLHSGPSVHKSKHEVIIKVRDDANLLKKSLKRQEQKKAASKKKWDDRTQKLNDKIQAKQDKRKANIKQRAQQKKDKKIKKRIGAVYKNLLLYYIL